MSLEGSIYIIAIFIKDVALYANRSQWEVSSFQVLLVLCFQAEDRCQSLGREKNDLQSRLEENEEELAELMKKYKAAVQQVC